MLDDQTRAHLAAIRSQMNADQLARAQATHAAAANRARTVLDAAHYPDHPQYRRADRMTQRVMDRLIARTYRLGRAHRAAARTDMCCLACVDGCTQLQRAHPLARATR